MTDRRLRTPVAFVVGLIVAGASWFGFALPASAASQHYLHSHIDAYSANRNCGPVGPSTEWSSSQNTCNGWAGYGGNASPFDQHVRIEWSSASSSESLIGEHLSMPSGYSRWFKACSVRGNGGCLDWIAGAVRMPNGPFTVLTGKINGQTVHADNPHGGVEHPGGPLFLWVGHWGRVTVGNYAHSGYVFGLRGYLDY